MNGTQHRRQKSGVAARTRNGVAGVMDEQNEKAAS